MHATHRDTQAHIRTHIYIYTHTHTHTYIYIYMYIYIEAHRRRPTGGGAGWEGGEGKRSQVVGAAVPAAVCRWGAVPCCPGPGVGRCLSGVYNHQVNTRTQHTETYRHTYAHTHTHTHTHIYIYICIYIYVYIYIYRSSYTKTDGRRRGLGGGQMSGVRIAFPGSLSANRFSLPMSTLFLTRVDYHSYSLLSRLPGRAESREGLRSTHTGTHRHTYAHDTHTHICVFRYICIYIYGLGGRRVEKVSGQHTQHTETHRHTYARDTHTHTYIYTYIYK